MLSVPPASPSLPLRTTYTLSSDAQVSNHEFTYEAASGMVLTASIARHLTEVEESLRIAKQLIRDRLPDVDLSLELRRARNGDLGGNFSSRATSSDDETTRVQRVKRPRSESCGSLSPQANVSYPLYSNNAEEDMFTFGLESLISPLEDSNGCPATDIPPTVSADNSNMHGLGYEWDEQHDGARSCIDGMAALSIQNEQPGYLGLESSAGLLHLIQTYSSDPFSATANSKGPQSAMLPETRESLSVNLHKEIPSQKIESYIADYFNTYHISYPLVHQGLFMAQYHEIVPRPRNGWMALMYVVAAIGAFMVATSPNDDDLILFHCARSHLSINMLEVGNLTLVQSLSLISNYLQKRDRPNSSYNYLGLAVRMAFGLGLHKDLPRWNSNLLHEEIRRRTWWCLYIFDAGSTITFGRPLTITTAGIDAKLPLNTFDSNLTASTLSSPGNVEAPTIYTNVRVQSQFHLLTTSLYNRIISKPFPSAKQVLLWDDLYIGRWLELVPEYYREDAMVPERHALSHAIMTWRYKHLRMVIYRPFLIQNALMSSWHGPSPGACSEDRTGNTNSKSDKGSCSSSSVYAEVICERCLKESHETIMHVNKFWQSHAHTRMACWYSLYFLFSATLVPVISLRNDPQSPMARKWGEDIEIATRIVKSMVELSTFAERCFQTLESLNIGYTMQNGGQDASETRQISDSTNESPITQMLSMHPMMWPEAPEFNMDEQLWHVLYRVGS
jgi:transcriptional regulatory protein GAL4